QGTHGMVRGAYEEAVTRALLVLATAGVLSAAAADPFVAEYCGDTCHSARRKAGRLSLGGFDGTDAQVAEKVIRKLRSGMMPPMGAPRPGAAAAKAFLDKLEAAIDGAAAVSPGWRPFQRLTRAEYARAVRDLTGVETAEGAFLPPDTLNGGFDNI